MNSLMQRMTKFLSRFWAIDLDKRLAENPVLMTTPVTAMIWGLDFVRALVDMPKWRRWIVLVFMGADARHELNGLSETLKVLGYDISEGLWRTR